MAFNVFFPLLKPFRSYCGFITKLCVWLDFRVSMTSSMNECRATLATEGCQQRGMVLISEELKNIE